MKRYIVKVLDGDGTPLLITSNFDIAKQFCDRYEAEHNVEVVLIIK